MKWLEIYLNETNVFDEELDKKVECAILKNKDSLVKEKNYILEICFNVDLLNDARFKSFHLLHCNKPIKKEDDRIHEVLSWQLDKACTVLENQDIKSYSNTIQGVELNERDVIKIVLKEENKVDEEPIKKRKTKRMKVNSIIPNKKATQERINESFNDYMSKRYSELYHIFQDNNTLMSYLLEIEPTEDINVLYSAFCEQYRNLFFSTTEEGKRIRQALCEKAKKAIDKYVKENKLK